MRIGDMVSQNQDFAKLLIAVSFSTLGDGLTLLAIPWLASTITTNTLYVSFVSTAMVLPWLLLSIHSGLLIDTFSRKKILIGSIIVRILVLFFLLVLTFTKHINIPFLIVTSFLLGVTKVFYDSTAQTVVPNVVNKDFLEKANGYILTSRLTMSDIVGRAIGGLLIASSILLPFIVDIFTLFITIFILLLIKKDLNPSKIREKPKVIDGFIFVKNNKILKYLAFIGIGTTIMFSATLSIQVFYVREVLDLQSLGYGILISVGTIGSIVGSQSVSIIKNKIGFKNVLVFSLLGMGITFGLVGISSNAVVVAILFFLGNIFIVTWNITNLSYRQRYIPNEKLGRVGGVFRLFSLGMTPLGMILGGWMVILFEPLLGRNLALRMPNITLGIVLVTLSIILMRLLSDKQKVNISSSHMPNKN